MPTAPFPSFEEYMNSKDEPATSANVPANASASFPSFEEYTASETPTKSAGFLQTTADIGLGLAKGVVDVGQSVVGLASLASGGKAGEILRSLGYDPEETNKIISSYQSEAQQAADKAVSDAKGFVDTLTAYAKNPRAVVGAVAESAPGVASMGVAARTAALKIAEKAAVEFGGIATEAGAKAAQAAVEKAAGKLMWISSGVEGAQSAGQIADQAQSEGRTYSDYALPSLAAGAATGLIGRAAGGLMGSAEIGLFTGSKAGAIKGSLPVRVAKSIFSEGFLEEMPQSAQEQVFQNIAEGKTWSEGVAQAAASGLVVGGAVGGVMGGAQAHVGTEPAAEPTVETPGAIPQAEPTTQEAPAPFTPSEQTLQAQPTVEPPPADTETATPRPDGFVQPEDVPLPDALIAKSDALVEESKTAPAPLATPLEQTASALPVEVAPGGVIETAGLTTSAEAPAVQSFPAEEQLRRVTTPIEAVVTPEIVDDLGPPVATGTESVAEPTAKVSDILQKDKTLSEAIIAADEATGLAVTKEGSLRVSNEFTNVINENTELSPSAKPLPPHLDPEVRIADTGAAAFAEAMAGQPGVLIDPKTSKLTWHGEETYTIDPNSLPFLREDKGITRWAYQVMNVIAQVHDTNLVIYKGGTKAPEGFQPKGITSADGKKYAFVADTSYVSPIALVGHELRHAVETTTLGLAFTSAVETSLSPEARAKARERHDVVGADTPKEDQLSETKILNEISADIAGSLMIKRPFWDRVVKHAQSEYGHDPAKQPLLDFLGQLRDNIDEVVQETNKPAWEAADETGQATELAGQYVENMDHVTKVFASSIASMYAEQPAHVTAEFARQLSEREKMSRKATSYAIARSEAPPKVKSELERLTKIMNFSPKALTTEVTKVEAAPAENGAPTGSKEQLYRVNTELPVLVKNDHYRHATIDAGSRVSATTLKESGYAAPVDEKLALSRKPKPIVLEHYTTQEKLTTIHPAKHGTGRAGAEMARKAQAEPGTYIDRSYFYREGAKPEDRFKGLHKYSLTVDQNKLFDLAGSQNPTADEAKAKKEGYLGAYNSKGSDPKAVMLFHPQPATRVLPPGSGSGVEDLHALAEAKGMEWDNSEPFMDFTEQVTGVRHLDDLTPKQRQKLKNALLDMETPNQPLVKYNPLYSEMATSTEGKAFAGMDPRIMKILSGNLYSGDLGKIAIKEMLQNSVDSLRAIGTKGKIVVNVDSNEKIISVKDNGSGMTPAVATKELMDVGGSKKEEGSSGGFGIAKVAIFANAEHIRIETVAVENGKTIETTLEGSGTDWADQSKGLTVTSAQVADDTPTGTNMEVKLTKETSFSSHSQLEFIKQFISTNLLPATIEFNYNGDRVTPDQLRSTGSMAMQKEPIKTIETDAWTMRIFSSTESRRTSYISATVLNHGLPQFNKPFYFPAEFVLPYALVIDVQAKSGPEEEGYPFRPDREGLRDAAETAIQKFVTLDLASEAVNKEHSVFKAAIDAGVKIGETNDKIYDTSMKIDKDFVEALARRPYVQALTKGLHTAFGQLQRAVANYDNRYAKVNYKGIGLGDSYLGINIRSELTKDLLDQNMVLINPYITMREVIQLANDGVITKDKIANTFADQLVATLVHELSHQVATGHTEKFAGENTRNQGRLVFESVSVARRLRSIVNAQANTQDLSLSTLETITQAIGVSNANTVSHAIQRDLASLEGLWIHGEDVFAKIGSHHAGPDRPLGRKGGPLSGGEIRSRTGETVQRGSTRSPGVVEPGAIVPGSVNELLLSPKSKELNTFLKGSVDKHPVYHSTYADFVAFDPLKEIGIHVGTEGQARDRFDTVRQGRPDLPYRTLQLWMSLTKPLRMKDAGTWDGPRMRDELMKKFPGTTRKDLIFATPSELREFIQSKGYNGIVYRNTGEITGGETLRIAKDNAFARGQSTEFFRAYDEYEAFKKANAEDSYIVFSPEQLKSATGNSGAYSKETGDVRFSPKQVGTAATPVQPLAPPVKYAITEPTWMDKVVRILQDKNTDIAHAVEQIKKAGGVIPVEANPVLQEEMYHKRAEYEDKQLKNNELMPLLTRMSGQGVTMTQLDDYLHARHLVVDKVNAVLKAMNPTMQNNTELGGMSDTEAASLYNPQTQLKLEPLAKMVDAILKLTRDKLVGFGLEKASTIAEWERQFKAYVPLRREGHEEEGYPTGTGRSTRGPTARTRLGSESAVTSILANVVQARAQAVTRGEKQRPVIAFAAMSMLHPSQDWQLVKPAPIQVTNPLTGQTQIVPGAITLANGGQYGAPMVRYKDPNTGLVEWRPDPTYKGRDNVVNFRVQGLDYAIVFDENNARAMQIAHAFKNIDTPALSGIFAAVAPFTRYLAAINTQYNPLFGIINFVRDTQFAMLSLSSTPLAGMQKEVLKETLTSMREIYADARAIRRGQGSTSVTAAAWNLFQSTGGPTGYRDMFLHVSDRAENLERLLTPQSWAQIRSPADFAFKIQNTALFSWLSDYNTTAENAVRLAIFKVAMAKGMSPIESASLGKNATVNFNKKGQLGAQIGSLYAFFNANAQGTARIIETLFEKTPSGYATLSATGKKIVLGGVLLGVLQAFALAMAGYDDDEPPEFIKQRALILPLFNKDKHFITIPMPLGFNVLPSIGRLTAETLIGYIKTGKGHPIDHAMNLLSATFGALNPVGGAGGGLTQNFSPSVLDPIVALEANKDWTGKPIFKEDLDRLRPTPGASRGRDNATVWSKAIAEAINYVTGGNKYAPGALSPTPEAIDYVIAQATGGVGREVSKTAKTIEGVYTGEGTSLYNVPLAGRFLGTASDAAAIHGRFYETAKKINVAYEELLGRAKDHAGKDEFMMKHPEARLYKLVTATEAALHTLKLQKEALVNRSSSRDAIKMNAEQVTALMRRVNDRYREMTEK